jgi:hypothetical protein
MELELFSPMAASSPLQLLDAHCSVNRLLVEMDERRGRYRGTERYGRELVAP